MLVAYDAVLYTDGGGKRRAALNPIIGRDGILRFCEGVKTKGGGFASHRAEPATLNGLPGFVFHTAEGTETIAFEVAGQRDHGDLRRGPSGLDGRVNYGDGFDLDHRLSGVERAHLDDSVGRIGRDEPPLTQRHEHLLQDAARDVRYGRVRGRRRHRPPSAFPRESRPL
ncbi:MAG: hypothetical protein A2V77_15295 [Anaeromyxobacter sp. RBG_16_69_14]|nr:MAG: hypothetical protein A2V77_15295 [Anaeromyxobacter sp. RBG_16_69_14]